MNSRSTLIAGLVGGLAGALLTVAALYLTGTLKAKPMPVAVVNLAGLIKAQAHGDKVDDAAVKAGFTKMRQVGEALAAKGYLVLDASAVVNAPDEFYVPRRAPRNSQAATDDE